MSLVMTSHQALSPSLQRALTASVLNSTFNDTAFYLLSRHAADGKASAPRVVFGSSTVMKASTEYFKSMFEGWLSSDVKVPEDSEDYDYDADSDLDEDEELEEIDDMASELSSVASVSSCATVTEKPACPETNIKDEKNEKEGSAKAPETASVDIDPAANARYKIFVPNVAATTWQALICFIYTGKVYFAPLRSNPKKARRLAHEQHNCDFPDGLPLCSPKAMYRLAELVGLHKLKDFAEKAIEENLSESCIVDEVFSPFSASHPDILAKQLKYLYAGGRLARLMPKVRKLMSNAMRGSLPHAETALDLLLTKLSELLSPPRPIPPEISSPPEGTSAAVMPSRPTPERSGNPTAPKHGSNAAASDSMDHSASPINKWASRIKSAKASGSEKPGVPATPSSGKPASMKTFVDGISSTDPNSSPGMTAAQPSAPEQKPSRSSTSDASNSRGPIAEQRVEIKCDEKPGGNDERACRHGLSMSKCTNWHCISARLKHPEVGQ